MVIGQVGQISSFTGIYENIQESKLSSKEKSHKRKNTIFQNYINS